MSNEVATQSEFSISETGVLELKSLREQIGYADKLIKANLISGTFKSPQQVVIAFQMLKSANLPSHLISGMYVVNGKPSMYGSVFVGMALKTGQMTHFSVEWFDEQGETIKRPKKGQIYFGCEVTVGRLGVENKMTVNFTMDDKERAGLKNPVWNSYPKVMLANRAIGMALKFLFADCLNGMDVYESIEEVKDSTEAQNIANEISKQFS